MSCFKLPNYKQKLPRQWTVLCRKIKTTNPMLNQAFSYDNIGNRITSSNNNLGTNYTTNNLNQYTSIASNSSVPSASENIFPPTFDDDGNQTHIKTSTGTWDVTYNGENRPIKFTQNSKSIEMKYDYMGRRIEYISKLNNVVQSHKKFMYDGYTLIQTLNESNQPTQEFVWDPTAGSATRPLFLRLPVQAANLLYCHDANKNVTEVSYLATANGIGAHYEYDSFGNTITSTRNTRVSSPDLRTYNPFRFSSEYHDDELALIYYNYRHYNPQSGRWISRDPIEENGGINLYGMCKNKTINTSDDLGLLIRGADLRDTPCPSEYKKLYLPKTLPGSPKPHDDIYIVYSLVGASEYASSKCLLCIKKVTYRCFYRAIYTIEDMIKGGLSDQPKVTGGTFGGSLEDIARYSEHSFLETQLEFCNPFKEVL